MWPLVGFLFFSYHNDAMSNKHQIPILISVFTTARHFYSNPGPDKFSTRPPILRRASAISMCHDRDKCGGTEENYKRTQPGLPVTLWRFQLNQSSVLIHLRTFIVKRTLKEWNVSQERQLQLLIWLGNASHVNDDPSGTYFKSSSPHRLNNSGPFVESRWILSYNK